MKPCMHGSLSNTRYCTIVMASMTNLTKVPDEATYMFRYSETDMAKDPGRLKRCFSLNGSNK